MERKPIVEQQIIPSSAALSDLPTRIERRCCYGKVHGNTTLHLIATTTTDLLSGAGETSIAYRRSGNDDVYYSFESDNPDDLSGLIGMLNNSDYWPLAGMD